MRQRLWYLCLQIHSSSGIAVDSRVTTMPVVCIHCRSWGWITEGTEKLGGVFGGGSMWRASETASFISFLIDPTLQKEAVIMSHIKIELGSSKFWDKPSVLISFDPRWYVTTNRNLVQNYAHLVRLGLSHFASQMDFRCWWSISEDHKCVNHTL